jgi:hypothetical protein
MAFLLYSLFKRNTMSDDLKKKGPQDRKRISLSEDWEVKYWCTALACSSLELTKAVKAVGNSVEAVKDHLKILRARVRKKEHH